MFTNHINLFLLRWRGFQLSVSASVLVELGCKVVCGTLGVSSPGGLKCSVLTQCRETDRKITMVHFIRVLLVRETSSFISLMSEKYQIIQFF